MPEGRTHTTLSDSWFTEHFISFSTCWDSLWGAFSLIITFFFRILFSPGFRHPAALIEELSDDDDIVAEDILGHSHPVNLDVLGKVFPAPHRVSVDGPIL